jgi:hypothetical protein
MRRTTWRHSYLALGAEVAQFVVSLFKYVYMFMCIYTYTYVSLYIYLALGAGAAQCVVSSYKYMYICIYKYTYICICLCAYKNLHINVYGYIWIYVYIHITHININGYRCMHLTFMNLCTVMHASIFKFIHTDINTCYLITHIYKSICWHLWFVFYMYT